MGGGNTPPTPHEDFGMRECWNNLALAIVQQAVEDWKLLDELGYDEHWIKNEGHISYRELERFFHSDWCDFLLSNTNLTGMKIYKTL